MISRTGLRVYGLGLSGLIRSVSGGKLEGLKEAIRREIDRI